MRTALLSAAIAVGFAFSVHAQTPELTATCKDGSSWSGASRRGACRGHQGVQAFGTTPAAPAVAAAVAPSLVTPAPVAPAPATPAPAYTPPARTVAPMRPTPAAVAGGGGPGQVWVNTTTHVYHCMGDRYYGHTRQGEFMGEAAAKAAGARPARDKVCS